MPNPPEQTTPNAYIQGDSGTQHDKETLLAPLQLGQHLKALRQQRSLTLQEVSDLTGIARSTLSKIENEQISPTFSLVNRLARGLNIDIPQLFSKRTQAIPPVMAAVTSRAPVKARHIRPPLTNMRFWRIR